MNWVWGCQALIWGILAVAEFQRYAKNKDKRSLLFACGFLLLCLLNIYLALLPGK